MGHSGEIRIVTDRHSWAECLEAIGRFDFYHTFDYHLADPVARGGKPVLLYYAAGPMRVALPLVVRQCSGKGSGNDVYFDATSVYGYPGPIANLGMSAEFSLPEFHKRLRFALQEMRVISVFSRLHPLIGSHEVLRGVGRTEPCGQTIAIDLTIPEEQQWQAYSQNHRRNIRKLRKAGVICEMSEAKSDLDCFVDMYTESMERVGAASEYFFDKEYFEALMGAKDFDMNLFICRKDGKPVCGGLFSISNQIVQYHLGGTDSRYLALAPTKIMFDSVRDWGRRTGCKYLHLGGGVGGHDDSLFRFKAGFSKQSFPFYVWKWIVEPEAYARLVESEIGVRLVPTLPISYEGYFPAYRTGQ